VGFADPALVADQGLEPGDALIALIGHAWQQDGDIQLECLFHERWLLRSARA
jgi:hypothetical protein